MFLALFIFTIFISHSQDTTSPSSVSPIIVSLPIVCEDLTYSQLNQCTRENGCALDEDECVALGEADPPKTPEAGKETKPVKCEDLPLTACLSQAGCVVDQSEGECASAPAAEAGEAAEGGEPVEAGDAAEDAAKAAARAAEAEKERQEEAAEFAGETAENHAEMAENAVEFHSEMAGETAENHAEMAENAVEFHSEMAENSAELAEGVVENQFQWVPKENTGGAGNGVVPVLQKPKQYVDPEEMMEVHMEAQEEQRERAEEAAEFAAENPGIAGVGSNNQPFVPDVFAPNGEAAEEAAEASQENAEAAAEHAEAAAEHAEEAAEAAAESGIGGIVVAPGTGNTDTTAAASDSSGSDAGSDSGTGADTTAAASDSSGSDAGSGSESDGVDTTAAANDSSGSNAGSGSESDGADTTAAANDSSGSNAGSGSGSDGADTAAAATSSAAPGADSGLPGLPNFLKVPKVCATVTTPEQCVGPSVAPDGEMPELGELPEWVCQWNTFTNGCVAMKFRHAMAGSLVANGGGIPNVNPAAAGIIPVMIEAEDYCPSILDPTKCVGMCRWIPYRNQCREIDLARSQMKPQQQSEPAESFKVTPTQVLICGIAFLLSVALGACIGIKYKHRSSSELASVPLNRYVDVDSYYRV